MAVTEHGPSMYEIRTQFAFLLHLPLVAPE